MTDCDFQIVDTGWGWRFFEAGCCFWRTAGWFPSRGLARYFHRPPKWLSPSICCRSGLALLSTAPTSKHADCRANNQGLVAASALSTAARVSRIALAAPELAAAVSPVTDPDTPCALRPASPGHVAQYPTRRGRCRDYPACTARPTRHPVSRSALLPARGLAVEAAGAGRLVRRIQPARVDDTDEAGRNAGAVSRTASALPFCVAPVGRYNVVKQWTERR